MRISTTIVGINIDNSGDGKANENWLNSKPSKHNGIVLTLTYM